MPRRGKANATRFQGLKPASAAATAAARGASKKHDTVPELVLRRELHSRGLRYRLASAGLPGRPDVVFTRAKVAVFCDGDFWHGRDLGTRLARLRNGHNAPYWVGKIAGNVARDRRNDDLLAASGWAVLRYWESDILEKISAVADEIAAIVGGRLVGVTH